MLCFVSLCGAFRYGVALVPGQPRVRHQSASSPVVKHCSQTKAPRASPVKASSRSSLLAVLSDVRARASARRCSSTTGITSACSRSRWRSHVSLVCASEAAWKSQKLVQLSAGAHWTVGSGVGVEREGGRGWDEWGRSEG